VPVVPFEDNEPQRSFLSAAPKSRRVISAPTEYAPQLAAYGQAARQASAQQWYAQAAAARKYKPETPLGTPNLKAQATKALDLNEQEQNLYQHHLDNLKKGGVPDPSGRGGTSTILMQTFEHEGKAYTIPTVWNNKLVSGDQAWDNAVAKGLNKFPSYSDETEAVNRYMQIHDYMEKDVWQ
jgi:hypothetical protein